jgi:hypothetical protein
MRYLLVIISAVAYCCSTKPTDETASDSTAIATDTTNLATGEEPDDDGRLLSHTMDDGPMDDDALRVYHSEYKLESESAAEQARVSLRFLGNRTFDYSIDYQVADFCSAQEGGTFTLDEDYTASDTTDAGRAIRFTLLDGKINIYDETQLGVGVCGFAADYTSCNGECEPISWDSYGDYYEEGEEATEQDSTGNR